MAEFDIKAAARRIRAKKEAERQEAQERRARAQEFGRRLAQRLGEADSRVVRVWGFGSTYETRRPYRLNSDLDIAVEGGDWFRLLDEIPPSEFEVSLIDLGDQRPEFIQMVRARGELLYERS